MNYLEYLLLADHRFMPHALKELARLFADGKPAVVKRLSRGMATVDIDADEDAAANRLSIEAPVFIDMLLPVHEKIDTNINDESLLNALKGLVSKESTFRLEVKRVRSAQTENAKGIEVRLGMLMEGIGYRVDMEKPDVLVYIIFVKDSAIICKAGINQPVMDWFRFFNRIGYRPVSRAEFKLDEAVRYFRIDMDGVHSCLDVGAAPGGWADYLARREKQVVAVDRADLDYDRLQANCPVITVTNKQADAPAPGVGTALPNVAMVGLEEAADTLKSGTPAIIHLKEDAAEAGRSLALIGKFDMLTIDVNAATENACEIAVSMAALLRPGAPLIMTLKMVDMDVWRRIEKAKEALAPEYTSIRMKKLPHNRQEVTLFALRNG